MGLKLEYGSSQTEGKFGPHAGMNMATFDLDHGKLILAHRH